MPHADVIERIVERVGELPAMPHIVAEVLQTADDPTSDMSHLSDALQTDPALTAKILRVSNSPYYGMKQYIGTLKLALVILGVREVRNIVLGVSVFETLKNPKGDNDLALDLWNRSLGIAYVSKTLSASLGLGLQGEDFIAGLLSDIGKLVLWQYLEDVYVKMLDEYKANDRELWMAEMGEIGCNHADIAMAIAVRWNLPLSLSDALWTQYPSSGLTLADTTEPRLAALLRIAKCVVQDDFSAPETVSALRQDEAWAILDAAKNPISKEDRFGVLAAFAADVKHAPKIPL